MSLRQLLRTETAGDHKALDVVVGRMEIFESLENYVLFLSGMHQLYCNYGASVDAAALQAGLATPVADLMAAIEKDVAALSPKAENSQLSSVCQPVLDSPSEQWACGYVMEGSAMGARYMQKAAGRLVEGQRNSESGKTDGMPQGAEYLTKLAEDSYDRWPKFTEALDSVQICDDEVVAAARRVFRSAEMIFTALADEQQRC